MVKKNKDAPKSLNYQIDHLTEKIDMEKGTPIKNFQKKTLCKVVGAASICHLQKKKSTKTPARTCGPRTRVQEA